MSLENEDWNPLGEIPKTRKVKYSYSRDFLLSLSELDVCKKLPSGFDQSIISEFEDASQDRTRNVGAFSLNSFRGNDYSSSPPSKGDLSSYSKGVNGRWESRSSGQSDKDNDSLSSWDPESGRRCDNQSRKYCQNPEHDGLLGSGSFPRPSVYVSGASAPKVNADNQYKLNKTSEPYHPPRPYKAIRRENNDSCNNETFGSSESTSEDKVEEEKKRRASFETMRKEQHKALQQKQHLTEGKHGDKLDVTLPSEDSVDEKNIPLNRSSESDDPFIIQTSTNDMEKSSFPSQTLAVRPLVPPGFSSTVMERNSGTKFAVHSHLAEVDNSKLEDKLEKSKSYDLPRENLNYPGDNQPTIESDLRDKEIRKIIIGETPQASLDFFEGLKKCTNNSGAVKKNQGHSTSILETLFGNHLTGDDSSFTNLVEHDHGKGVDTWNRQNPQSSKFAQWFLEEEKRPLSNVMVNGPNEILSLIVRNEKSGHEVSGVESTNEKQTACAIPPSSVMPDQLHDNSNTGPGPTILTCADLEQSILSEIRESGPNSQPSGPSLRFLESDSEQLKSSIDNHASQHLLSLLQKEVDENKTSFNPSNTNKNRSQGFEDAKTDAKSSLGETLILETIFGTAFMKELQSVGAPVSVQAGVESQGLPSQIIDGVISSGNGSGSHMNSLESRVLASTHGHQKIDSSSLQTGFESKTGAFHDLQHFMPPINAQVDTTGNLSAMNSLSQDGRSITAGQQGSFFGGPYDSREAEVAFQKLNIQPSSSHFHPTQMNPWMKFMMPENPSNRDPLMNNQFHPNMLHPPFLRPNIELVGFDPSSHNPLSSHVQMPGNLPPHLLQGLSRGVSLPPFANQGNPQPPHINMGSSLPQMNNQVPGFGQELNSRQGFRIGQQQQPNFGNLRSEAAAQRLLEMELRSNLKKNNHFYGAGHSQGTIYGNELDMNFGYK